MISGAGRLTKESDPDGTIDYVYDLLGRVTTILQTVDGLTPEIETLQAYDATGNKTWVYVYLDGSPNTCDVYTSYYDNLNRLRRVYQSGPTGAVAPKMVYFNWDKLNRLSTMSRYEYVSGLGWKGVNADYYTYDYAGRLKQLQHKKGATTLSSYTWTFDRASRVTGSTSSLDGDVDYTYDSTGQLTGADYDYQTDETYSYDSNGNRTNGGYTTGDANQLTTDGTYTYQYDSEGNRTARFVDNDTSGTLTTGDTDMTEYTWDHRNRLTNVTNRATYGGSATQAVDYIYDIRNRLVGKILDPDGAGEDPATEEYYAYDGDQILLRFDGSETSDLVDRYLWAPAVDLLLSDEKLTGPSTPGTIYWTLGDNLNTIRDIALYNSGTDTTTIAKPPRLQRLRQPHQRDQLRRRPPLRLHRPPLRRIHRPPKQPQPLVRPRRRPMDERRPDRCCGGINLYAYCGNAPLTFTDPSGLETTGIHCMHHDLMRYGPTMKPAPFPRRPNRHPNAHGIWQRAR